jgi:hypothetical protein
VPDVIMPANVAANDRSSWLRLGAVLAGVLVAGAALAYWLWPAVRPRPAPAASAEPDEDVDRAMAVANPGYVGIENCAGCHPKRVAEFKTTRHFVACTGTDGIKAPGFAPDRGRCETRTPGLHFEMSRIGDVFFAAEVKAEGGGGSPRRTDYQLALVYGSDNRRDEMYFAWQGDRLVRVPLAWLYPRGRWGSDVDELRVLDVHPSCLECHNTWVGHTLGSPFRYRRDDALLGVTCERCHGPGRDHAEHHRKNPKDETAHAILHPGNQLNRERLMDLCAQCHGNTRMLRTPFSYRPGEPLEKTYRTARAKHREDDTTTNQVQYLGESKCYQKSTDLTCITCHSPHRPTPPAQSGCLKCHTAAASCPDQPRQPAAIRSDCVGCHMPQQIWMNSHFYKTADDYYVPVAPRSEHRIGVYPRAKQAVTLAWLRKQTDAASRADADGLAAKLTGDYLKEAERLTAERRYKAAIGAYREALQIIGPKDEATAAPVRRRLAEVLARQQARPMSWRAGAATRWST